MFDIIECADITVAASATLDVADFPSSIDRRPAGIILIVDEEKYTEIKRFYQLEYGEFVAISKEIPDELRDYVDAVRARFLGSKILGIGHRMVSDKDQPTSSVGALSRGGFLGFFAIPHHFKILNAEWDLAPTPETAAKISEKKFYHRDDVDELRRLHTGAKSTSHVKKFKAKKKHR